MIRWQTASILVVIAVALGFGLGFWLYQRKSWRFSWLTQFRDNTWRPMGFLGWPHQTFQYWFLEGVGKDFKDYSFEGLLALGACFRQGGEGNRALKVHQSLQVRQDLKDHQKHWLGVQLLLDYCQNSEWDKAKNQWRLLPGPWRKQKVFLALDCLIETNSKNFKTAVKILNQLSRDLSSQPGQVAWNHLAETLMSRLIDDKKWKLAQKQINHLPEFSRDGGIWHLMQAKIFAGQEKIVEANEHFKRYLQECHPLSTNEMSPLLYNINKGNTVVETDASL